MVERSLSPLESHGGFPGFFLATGPVAAFPWFALALAAAWAARRAMRDARTVFLLAWLLGPLIVFEMVRTKLVHYWMPSYAAGVLLVVAWLLSGPVQPRRWASWVTAFGGLVLAAAPVAIVVHLGLGRLLPTAIACAVPAAAAAIAAGVWLHRRPLPGLVTATAGSVLWLLLVATLLLPALGPTFSGLRAAQALIAARAPGDTPVVYRERDDDLFFNLPLDTVHCRSEAELQALLASGRPVVVVSRAEDFDRLRADRPELRLRTVAEVDGVDLGRGRWVRSVVFRPVEQ